MSDRYADPVTLAEIARRLDVSRRSAAEFALLGWFGEPLASGGATSFSSHAVEQAAIRHAREIAAERSLRKRLDMALRRLRR